MNAQVAAQIFARWNALARPLRVAILAAASLAIAGSIVAAAIAHAPRVALFSAPLRPEQLDEVEERLAEWNVPFAPAPDNVIVDASRHSELLLRLSLSGVPHAHVESSAEALAGVGVLTPPEVIDERTRAGLAGDIELALRSVDGVDDARVIIAPSKPAEFAGDAARDARASVRLWLRPGERLSPEAISGIRAFVASGVAGLDLGRVTILDDRGVALGDEGGEKGADAVQLQASLQSALDAAFGSGATIVRVRADLDRNATSQHEVVRSPVGTTAIAQDGFTETYSGDGKRYEKRGDRADRGSDVRETTSTTAAGGVSRVSTAVFVDAARSIDLTKVRELASAVVGYDARRGDELSVQAVAFDRPPVHSNSSGRWLMYGAFVSLVPALMVAIAIVAAARYLVRPIARALRHLSRRGEIARRSVALTGIEPARVHGALVNEPAHAAAAIISALPAATAAAVLELYPAHEREAIVRRMQRRVGPLVPTAADVLGPYG
ncbi:MAG: flagellar M-ring protein FliF C-terminal domain-containing protein [Vulcanimicrobiaceae bacterium]